MDKGVVSLFAGAGGCTLGFEKAGFDVNIGIDVDEDTVQTYQRNFPKIESIKKDIREIDADWLMNRTDTESGEIDFLIGGPPCQGFSSAGKKFWDDPRNRLLKHYIRILEQIKPKWFLMENVEGLLTAQKSKYIHEISKKFVEIGYTIRIHKLYSHWYGLPQKRKRVFIVGNSADIKFDFPTPTHHGISAKSSPRSIMDGISDLPQPSRDAYTKIGYPKPTRNKYQESLRGEAVNDHSTANISEILLNRITHLNQGQSMQDLPEHLQHNSFEKRAFRRVKDGMPTEKRGGPPSGIKRLKPDEPSLTITTGSDSEFIHPYEDRFLTLRECARIQSFPDSFRFEGSKTSRHRQVANAIPPLIAKTLAQHFERIIEENKDTTYGGSNGELLGFYLTKANSRSPALERTHDKLNRLRLQSQIEA